VAGRSTRSLAVMRTIIAILLLTLPGLALAEVSDKVPHEMDIVAFAAVSAIISFFVASRRWWLGAVGVSLTVLAIVGAVDLLELREALWAERGLAYFLCIGVALIAIPIATSAGIVRGWRQR
jgi:hypothetical protein